MRTSRIRLRLSRRASTEQSSNEARFAEDGLCPRLIGGRQGRALKGLAVVGVVACGMMVAASAQSVDATPSFEIVSIRPNAGTGLFTLAVQPGGRFVATRVRLRELIRFAYQVQPFQIEDRSPSADQMLDRQFDVIATASGGELPPIRPGVVGVVNRMVQRVLANRFKLQLQQEKRQMDVYELVLARTDGQVGKQMLDRTADCERGATLARSGGGAEAAGRNGDNKTAQLTLIPCGRTNLGAGLMRSGGVSMSGFTQTLTSLVGRGVLDKTGLPGIWALELRFAPLQPVGAGATTSLGATAPAFTDPDRPSIFTALQEQLGLELRSARDSVDVLVVAEVSEPTPN